MGSRGSATHHRPCMKPKPNLKKLWPRLRAMSQALHPQLPNAGMNPPATLEQIAHAEAQIGLKFPADLKKLYLLANGMNNNSGLLLGHRWLPLDDPSWLQRWQLARDADADPELRGIGKEVRANCNAASERVVGWFPDRKRIPLGESHSDVCLLVDMHPASGGDKGQIIAFDVVDDGNPVWYAPGVLAFLNRLVEAWEKSEIRWDPDQGWVSGVPGLEISGVMAGSLARASFIAASFVGSVGSLWTEANTRT